MNVLTDKVAYITGGSKGIGFGIAKILLENGMKVAITSRSISAAKEAAGLLSDDASKVLALESEVSSMASETKAVKAVTDHFGKLDMVVTNAGKLGLGSVTDISIDDWNETIGTNLNAVFYLSRFAIPEMQKNGRGVLLVNSSIAAFKSFPNHAAYCASKAALIALVKEMALDYGPAIRVNAMCPGPVDTPLIWDSAKAFENPESIVQQTANNTLMKRLGKPEDIASLALFLVSDEASWITGSAFTIDGGILTR